MAAGAAYYGAMGARIGRPHNCQFYTLDLKEDFRAKCEVCLPGFVRPDNSLTCVPENNRP